MNFKTFIFNPFQENTYVIYDDTNKCIVVDPGNFSSDENEQLDEFFEKNNLTPVQIVNTHNHLDHIFGNHYLSQKYGLESVSHADDLFWIDNFLQTAQGYGIAVENTPKRPTELLTEEALYKFGNTEFQVIHVPGHSPGSVALYNKKNGFLFSGDILFRGSIGRTDLPGGDHKQQLTGIKEKLLVLPGDTRVYCGHGPSTTIEFEKNNNPFFL